MHESETMEVPVSASPMAGERVQGTGLALRILGLAAVFLLASAVAAVLVGVVAPAVRNWRPADLWSPGSLAVHYVVALLYASAVVLPILRTRWRGWPLVLTVFWAMTAMTVVLPWIELVVFNLREVGPPGMGATFVALTIAWALFAPAAAFLIGPSAPADPVAPEENRRLRFGFRGWVGRLAAIPIAYIVLYFVFGALIWSLSPDLRAFYMSTEMPGLGTIVATQFGRGLLWAAVALPIVRMMRGPRWETVVAVGLLFAVVINAALLLPNPLLAAEIRYAHLLETATSNFLFGVFVGWILTPRWTLDRTVGA